MSEIKSCNDRKVVLKNVPNKFSDFAIKMMFREYKTKEIEVDRSHGHVKVFVEMENFSDVDRLIKYMQDLRDIDGTKMYAEHYKNRYVDSTEDQNIFIDQINSQESQSNEIVEIERPNSTTEIKLKPAELFIEFESHQHDDQIERVTDFKFRIDSNDEFIEYFEKFNKKTPTDIRNYVDMEFDNFCCVCHSFARLSQKDSDKKFCSRQCAQMLQNSEDDPDITKGIIHSDALKVKDVVKISAIINERILFVKHCKHNDGPLMTQVFKFAKKSSKLSSTPKVGEFVIAKYSKNYFRAQVLFIENERDVTVHLFDYGNNLRISFELLLKMSDQCLKIPCHAFKITLKNVKSESFNWGVVSYLNYLKGEQFEFTITEISGNEFVLKKSSIKTLNDEIQEMLEMKVTVKEKLGDFAANIDRENEKIDENSKYFITNLNPIPGAPEIVTVQPESLLKDFFEIYKAANIFGENSEKEVKGVPKDSADNLCLVKFNHQWHRAEFVEKYGDGKPLVLMIDTGKEAKIRCDNIFFLPEALYYPETTIKYVKIDQSLKNDLKEGSFISGKELIEIVN